MTLALEHRRTTMPQTEFVGTLDGLVGTEGYCLAEGRKFRVLRWAESSLATADGPADLDDVYRMTAFGDNGQARWVRRQDGTGVADAAWLGVPSAAPDWTGVRRFAAAHIEPRQGIVWGVAQEQIVPGWTRFNERNVGDLFIPIDARPGQRALVTWDVFYEADADTGLLRAAGQLYRTVSAVDEHQIRHRFQRTKEEK